MERESARAMAEAFVKAFYTQGNIQSIMETADQSIVAFGPQSVSFALGKEAVARCLKKEHDLISPCKLFRSHLRERNGELDEVSVNGVVVVRSNSSETLFLHQITLTYCLRDNAYCLTGIHMMRNLHHESTYRMVYTRMLASAVEADKLRSGGREVDVVSTYAQSAFVIYSYGENERKLVEFTDDLWKMLDYPTEEEFIGSTGGVMRNAMIESDIPRVQTIITSQLAKKDIYKVEYPLRTYKNASLWVMECGRRVKDDGGRIICYATLIDITPLKQTSERLLYQISYDDLTGLLNKTAFCQMTQEILANNPDEEFELMVMDIERFKVINDLFGEETGDKILRYFATFFRETSLPNSVFSRIHSDRFMMFYPKGSNDGNRSRFIKSLKVLAASYTLGYRILLHFGIYTIRDHHMAVSSMCDRAMLALMKAKQQGVLDAAEYNEAMRHNIVAEQGIINEMTEALSRGDFVLFMQPKYDAMTEHIIGAEALVRWKHPTRGMISPSEFIPVFEHNGFIFQLDQFVWEETARHIRKWIDEGRDPFPVSVNVSRVDFYSTQLISIIETIVKKYDLPPELMELEITESAYTDNPQQIINITKQLQQRGFRILMDDFGSGYSSLNMLKELPVDVLKIDLKFLDDQGDNKKGGNILNSVVRMAKWMRIPVIVEGVETRQQVDFLRTIGCHSIQGFYFSKPVPVFDYEAMLDRQHKNFGINPMVSYGASWPDKKDFEELLNPDTNFNLLFNGMLGGVGLYEYDNGVLELLRANDAFFSLVEASSEAVLENGRNIIPFIYEEDKDNLINAIERAREGHEITQCILRRRLLNGNIKWFRVRASIILEDAGRMLLFLAWEDASEVYEIPLQLQNMIDGFPAGLSIVEIRDGVIRVVYMNRWLWELDGRTADSYNRQNPVDFVDLVGDMANHFFVNEVKKAEKLNGKPYKIEYPFTKPDGEEVWLRATLNVKRRGDGSLICYSTVYDITGEHRMDEVKNSNTMAAINSKRAAANSFEQQAEDLAALRRSLRRKEAITPEPV